MTEKEKLVNSYRIQFKNPAQQQAYEKFQKENPPVRGKELTAKQTAILNKITELNERFQTSNK